MFGIFTSDEIEKLRSILKLILPPGETGMPEAAIILNWIDADNLHKTRFVELSKVICNKMALNQIKNEEELEQFKKANFREFSIFVNIVFILYYSNPIVLSKLEIGSVPPFPEGNIVKEGDVYLLEPVFSKGKIFRD